jgi:CheY-like chemotaxis protein
MSGYVLIVDDNDDSREIMALILAHAGYMTSQARDGAEALAGARTRPPAAARGTDPRPRVDAPVAHARSALRKRE